MSKAESRTCPHCGEPLKKWATPANSTWTDEYHWVCFNDECEYYVKGWKQMEETRGVQCSYRYMCGQNGRNTGPLSVPHPQIGRTQIIIDEDEEIED